MNIKKIALGVVLIFIGYFISLYSNPSSNQDVSQNIENNEKVFNITESIENCMIELEANLSEHNIVSKKNSVVVLFDTDDKEKINELVNYYGLTFEEENYPLIMGDKGLGTLSVPTSKEIEWCCRLMEDPLVFSAEPNYAFLGTTS